MRMVAPRWSQQGWPPYQIMSLETKIGMAVAGGSKPGAAVGELGLQYPLGTESLDDSEDLRRGRRQSSNQKRFFLFFRRRINEKGKSPVKAKALRMTGGDGGDRLYLLKKKREEKQVRLRLSLINGELAP
ncbi:hypothetical protein AAC387_Pa04g1052 [Persea americana]